MQRPVPGVCRGPAVGRRPAFDGEFSGWRLHAPIGLLVVGGPAALLLGVRTRWVVRLGQIAIGVVGVVSMVAVARSEDAQAGLAFLWGPILGSGAAAAVGAADAWLRRPRRGG